MSLSRSTTNAGAAASASAAAAPVEHRRSLYPTGAHFLSRHPKRKNPFDGRAKLEEMVIMQAQMLQELMAQAEMEDEEIASFYAQWVDRVRRQRPMEMGHYKLTKYLTALYMCSPDFQQRNLSNHSRKVGKYLIAQALSDEETMEWAQKHHPELVRRLESLDEDDDDPKSDDEIPEYPVGDIIEDEGDSDEELEPPSKKTNTAIDLTSSENPQSSSVPAEPVCIDLSKADNDDVSV